MKELCDAIAFSTSTSSLSLEAEGQTGLDNNNERVKDEGTK